MAQGIDIAPEIAEDALNQIVEGLSLRKIAKKHNVSPGGLCDLLNRDYLERYTRARQLRASYRFDSIEEILDQLLHGDLPSDKARVAIDTYKWMAGKENHGLFGDKVTNEIHNFTLRDIIGGAAADNTGTKEGPTEGDKGLA